MRLAKYSAVPFLLALVACVIVYLKSSTGGSNASDSVPLRVVLFGTPPSRDLGVVAPGTRVEVPFVLVNEGEAAVNVGEIKTSCECLAASQDGQEVGAGGSVRGDLVLDMGNDPNYSGGLMLTAEAKVAGDATRTAFVIRLSVEVR